MPTSISLRKFFSGDLDYIEKHNLNNSDIENCLNPLKLDVDGLKAAGSPGSDQDFRQIAQNLIVNGAFDFWQRGTNTRPDVWKIENETPAFKVEQDNDNLFLNTFSVKTTGKGQLTQELDQKIVKSITGAFQVAFSIAAKTDTIASARIGIYNGVTTLFSNDISGDGNFEQGLVTFVAGTSFPTELKFVLDSQGGEVYWNAAVAIRGNPSSGPIFVANDPTTEELRVLSFIERDTVCVKGVGVKNVFGEREFVKRVTFEAPKRELPIITLKDDIIETGFDFDVKNITRFGFDLVAIDETGKTIWYGMDLEPFDWCAETPNT